MVGQQGFAVVEQSSDQGAFAVIDAAGGNEAERGLVLCRYIFFLISA
ncbi:TPA: hypothetical protein ACLAM9_000148 [Neisseria meningitidis]